jgi:CheY-like chemotaxis protein
MFKQRLRSVLILEDESLLSMAIEDTVRDLGAERVLSFTDSAQAEDRAKSEDLDCAILDVMIRGEPSFRIADILEARGIPFVFSSGLVAADLEDRHRHRPFLSKPFSDEQLKEGIRQALACFRPGGIAEPA